MACHGSYMEDCIHLHACRRMALLYALRGKPKSVGPNHVARGCNEECNCYQTFVATGDMVATSTASRIGREYMDMLEYGHSIDDLCVEIRGDMEAESIEVGYIANGPCCDDENGVSE